MNEDNCRRQAVSELVDEYSLNPVLFKTGAIHQLLCNIEDSYSAAKGLAQLLDYRDFEWGDFDKCVAFCEKYDIRPSAYWFLDKKPQEPETLKEFLETLTVPEIKRLAKQKGIAKLPARKAEIIEKVCAEADLQDFEADVEAALQEREEAYHAAEFRAKCEALVRDVLARASSIRQTKQSAASGLVFRYSISEQSKDDREMAYLMMGGYHTAEDGQGGLKSLPPFFPGDSAWVSADWDRSIKYKTDFFADPAAYAAQPQKHPAASRPVGIVQKAAEIKRKILAFPYIKQIAIGFSVLILLAVFKSLSTADRFRFVFFAIMLLLPLLVWWIWRGIRNGR
jgi:hypothetical protein